MKFFNHPTCKKPRTKSETKFNAIRESPSALPHISWVLYLSRQNFILKESLKIAISLLS